MNNKKTLSRTPWQVATKALEYAHSNVTLFIFVALLSSIIFMFSAPEHAGENFEPLAISFYESLIVVLIGYLIELVPMSAYAFKVQQTPKSSIRIVGHAFCRLIPYLLAMLIASIVLAVGLFALFIPGIFVAIYFSAVPGVLIAERQGIFGSLARSIDLVSSHKMATLKTFLWMFLILMILHIIAGLITFVFSVTPDIKGIVARPLLYVILVSIYTFGSLFSAAVFILHYHNLKTAS